MSQSYPGTHKAVGKIVNRYISTSIAYIPLVIIFGLPALVVAFAASYYVPAIPEYSVGYVFIALVAVMVIVISNSVNAPSENDIDPTELDQSQIRVLFAVLTISTVLMIGSVILIAGAVATIVQYLIGMGYVTTAVAAGIVFLDEWMSNRNSRFSVGSWGFLAGIEISNAYFAMRYNSRDRFDDEVERSARRGGPIL